MDRRTRERARKKSRECIGSSCARDAYEPLGTGLVRAISARARTRRAERGEKKRSAEKALRSAPKRDAGLTDQISEPLNLGSGRIRTVPEVEFNRDLW